MHASTFGGNPIASAAGIAMLETIEEEGLLEQAASAAALFSDHLRALHDQCAHIREIRQAGLMIGIELDSDGTAIVQRCLENGLLINCTQGNVLRLLPAMNIQPDQVQQGMEVITRALVELASPAAEPDSLASP